MPKAKTATSAVLPEVRQLRALQARRDLARVDLRRYVAQLAERYQQREVARWLNVSQPAVSKMVKTAAQDPNLVDGFSGATPREICQRFAADEITREQVVDELARFPYPASDRTDGFDSLLVDPPGSFGDVELAVNEGLIDEDIYAEVFKRMTS